MRNISKLLSDLKRVMKRQEGTPEAKLASEIYEQLQKKYPGVKEVEDVEIEWEHRFEIETFRDLWEAAAEANNIGCFVYRNRSRRLILSKGKEVDMIVAKAEWQHAVDQYLKLNKQVFRAVVNKVWPQICKPNDKEEMDEDEMLCLKLIEFVKPHQDIPQLSEPKIAIEKKRRRKKKN